jgi:serine/threonine-protein kinase
VLVRCLDKLAIRRAPIADVHAALEASLRSGASPVQPRDRAIRAVAVLPFENSSGDPETEYLGDGLAESAIFSLSQLPSLRVMARGTVFRYKGRIGDPAEVGRELGVEAVLSGRVLQRGDSLVVSAELIDSARGWQLWGAQYRRTSSDLLAIEREIASEITDALRMKLSAEDKTALVRRYTQNAEAYRLYLKGRYYWGKRTEDALHKGIAYFREALELDPTYALAYAGLAEGYVPLAFYGHLAPRDALPKARAAAKRALEIDPGLAEAQTVLAATAEWDERDFASMERAARAAIDLDQSYPRAWQALAEIYMMQGRFDDAFTQIKRALELDPLSLAMHAATGMVCYYGRRHELAAEYSRKCVEMDENFFPGYWILGLALEQQRDYAGAIAALGRARSLSSDSTNMIASLGGAYAASGDVAAARRIVAELDELAARRYVDQALVAGVFALLGDQGEALKRLERAHEDESCGIRRLAVDPRLDGLRGEPRFQDLVRRQGFLQL